eukprot:5505689-Pleurochrysis_carterae.AAC.1
MNQSHAVPDQAPKEKFSSSAANAEEQLPIRKQRPSTGRPQPESLGLASEVCKTNAGRVAMEYRDLVASGRWPCEFVVEVCAALVRMLLRFSESTLDLGPQSDCSQTGAFCKRNRGLRVMCRSSMFVKAVFTIG